MGFRWRQRVRLFPGVRLNFSRSGISTSVGGPGATVNIGRSGVRRTLGLPGTGMSWSSFTRYGRASASADGGAASGTRGVGYIVLAIAAVAIFAMLQCRRAPATPDAVAAPPAESAASARMTVTATVLKCRAAADPAAPVRDRLARGDTVAVVAHVGGWSQIDRGCWVSDAYLVPAQ